MSGFFIETQTPFESGKLIKVGNIKRNNRKLVLSLMDFNTPVSASEMSLKTQISKTTISKIFTDFCNEGILTHIGKGDSTNEGGKKPDIFLLNVKHKYAMVIQLAEPESISCTLLNLACEIVESAAVETNPGINYDDAINIVGELARNILKKANVTGNQLCGVAVSCDGIVDTENKSISRPAHHAWPRNLPVGKDISKALGFEADITVDNVCRFGGYAELLFPQNRDCSNMVIIWNDDLVGGCVLSDNKLIQGRGGLVGEFGHFVMELNSSIRCSCGGYGCFEPLVSIKKVVAQAYQQAEDYPDSLLIQSIKDHTLSIDDVFEASSKRDLLACRLLDEVVGYYAVLIRNITNLHDINKVIIQGSYAAAGNYFYESLKTRLDSYPLHETVRDIIIEASAYMDKSNRIIGAGFFVITNYFNNGMQKKRE